MARRTGGRRSSSPWQKMVAKYTRMYGVPYGTQMASKQYRLGSRANKPKRRKAKRRANPTQANRRTSAGIIKSGPRKGKLKKGYKYSGGRIVKVGGKKSGGKRRSNSFRYKVPTTANAGFRYTVPAGVVANKPKRRKKTSRRKPKRRSTRRSTRRNFRYRVPSGVVANPIFENVEYGGWGQSAQGRAFASGTPTSEAAVKYVKEFAGKDFLVNHMLPITSGFIGSKLVIGMLIPKLFGVKEGQTPDEKAKAEVRMEKLKRAEPWIMMGSGVIGGFAVGMAFKRTDIAMKVGTGAMLAGFVTLLERWQTYRSFVGLEGVPSSLGADVSDSLRKKLARAVREEVKKVEAGMSGTRGGFGAYVTEQDIRTPETFSNMDAYVTEEELEQPETGGFGNPQGGVSMDEYLAEPALF